MTRLSTGILIIILSVACLAGLTGTHAIADDVETGIDGSVTVIAVLDHITVTPVNPSRTLVSGSTPTLQFTANANYSNAPTADITNSANWKSDNISVATIDNTGLARILATGNTTISATFGVKTGDTMLIVSAESTSGGGGGGGGSSGVFSLAEYMTGDGLVITSATAESVDGQVKLYIPKGTIVKNRNGQRLYSISIKPSSTPLTPPDDRKFVCFTYDIGPSGATFNPPILLTFKYNDSMIPAGVAEENLVIATWLEGEWVEFEGCVVDTVNNTITVPISHFTTFTVMANTAAASFKISGMNITPADVYPGETITVSVTIANTGDLTGSFEVILKIDNAEIQNQMVTINGHGSQTVSFSVNSGHAGEHTVSVNNLSKVFVVKESVIEPPPTEAPVPTPEPVPTSEPVPTPAPTKVPVQTTAPTAVTKPTPTPTPVGALPVQTTDKRMRLIMGIVGGVLVITALALLLIRRRRP